MDIFIVALLIFGFIRGLFKGFVLGLSGLVGIIISIYVAKYFSAPAIRFAEVLLGIGQKISPIAGFFITLLVALLVFHFIAILVDKFVSLIALGWLNKLLGGLLSFFKYLFIISAFINVFHYANTHLGMLTEAKLQKSKLYTPVRKIIPATLPFLNLNEFKPE